MDKASKQIMQKLLNELEHERRLADQLAEALIHGGLDRQFEAVNNHEVTRNGFRYTNLGEPTQPSPEVKKQARRAKRSPNHPTYKWARPDKNNQDFWYTFNCEDFKINPPKQNKKPKEKE